MGYSLRLFELVNLARVAFSSRPSCRPGHVSVLYTRWTRIVHAWEVSTFFFFYFNFCLSCGHRRDTVGKNYNF